MSVVPPHHAMTLSSKTRGGEGGGGGAEEKRVGVSHRAHWGRKHIQYIHQTLVSYLRKREKFS